MPDNEREPLEAATSRIPGSDDVVGVPAGASGGVAYIDDSSPADRDFVPPPGRFMASIALGAAQSIDNSEGGVSRIFSAPIITAFGQSLSSLGLINSLSSAARMIFGPVWAILADKVGRKRVLFIVTGLWGLWTLAVGFAQTWEMFLLLYSIALIGTVASEPILNGLLGSLYAASERGKAFGTVRAVSAGLGILITPVLGAAFGGLADGWRYAMYTMGALSLISGVLILIFVHEPKKADAAESDDLKAEAGMFKLADAAKVMKIPTLALMAPMLLFVTSLVLFNFMGYVWQRTLGYGVANAAYLQTIFNVGAMFSAFLGGMLGDFFVRRFGHKGRVMLFQIYAVLFAIVAAVTMYLPQIFDPDISEATVDAQNRIVASNEPSIAYYAMVLVMGLVFSIGFSGCVLPMVSSVCPTQLSATSFALLFSLIQGAITTVYNLGVGIVSDLIGDVQLTLLLGVSVPYIINALFWFVFYKTYPRDVELQKERSEAIAAGTF